MVEGKLKHVFIDLIQETLKQIANKKSFILYIFNLCFIC